MLASLSEARLKSRATGATSPVRSQKILLFSLHCYVTSWTSLVWCSQACSFLSFMGELKLWFLKRPRWDILDAQALTLKGPCHAASVILKCAEKEGLSNSKSILDTGQWGCHRQRRASQGTVSLTMEGGTFFYEKTILSIYSERCCSLIWIISQLVILNVWTLPCENVN